MGETVCVRGRATCFLTVAPGGEHILVANYLDGSLVAVDRHADGTLGAVHEVKLPPSEYAGAVGSFPRANADRQDDAHAHMVKVSKVNEDGSAMLLVPDLGCDCVWMVEYTPRRAELPMRVVGMWPEQQGDVPAGAGPRHVVLHPSKDVNVAYVACELSSQVRPLLARGPLAHDACTQWKRAGSCQRTCVPLLPFRPTLIRLSTRRHPCLPICTLCPLSLSAIASLPLCPRLCASLHPSLPLAARLHVPPSLSTSPHP
eukprot:349676-Pleurochrysis_carterae.AAC.2